MLISPMLISSNTLSDNLSFQRGLTRKFLAKTKSLTVKEMEDAILKNGIKDVKNVLYPATAACCLATSEIFKTLGLSLPDNFSFAPIQADTSGCYAPRTDTVIINSMLIDSKSLKKVDERENYRKESPITKHFLQIYLHEFLHAAHIKNLKKQLNKDELQNFLDFLVSYAPIKDFAEPQLTSFEKKNSPWSKIDLEFNDYCLLGNYAYRNLIEFFAENGVYEITNILNRFGNSLGNNEGKNVFFNPKNIAGCSLSFLNNNSPQSKRNEFIKAIWDGNIKKIKSSEFNEFIKKKEPISDLKLNLDV